MKTICGKSGLATGEYLSLVGLFIVASIIEFLLGTTSSQLGWQHHFYTTEKMPPSGGVRRLISIFKAISIMIIIRYAAMLLLQPDIRTPSSFSPSTFPSLQFFGDSLAEYTSVHSYFHIPTPSIPPFLTSHPPPALSQSATRVQPLPYYKTVHPPPSLLFLLLLLSLSLCLLGGWCPPWCPCPPPPSS